MGRQSRAKKSAETPVRLDLACGQTPREGFIGVDLYAPDAQKVDLLKFPWPWAAESVEEAWCSHFFEHVPGRLRGQWMDELWRVLKVGATATILVPYYASMRAVQDFTHEWPPVAESSFLYFNRAWRVANKLDHYPVSCDFDFTFGYVMSADWAVRAEEARAGAIRLYQNVVNDLQVVLTKRP